MLMTYPGIGVVYNRIKKNANTTTVRLLGTLDTGNFGDKAPSLSRIPYAEIWALRKSRFLVIVRNPYTRLLSAFLEKFRREEYRQRHGDFAQTPAGFEAFVDWLAAGNVDKDGHWREQTHHLFMPLHKFDAVVRFENLRADMLSFLTSVGLSDPDDALGDIHRRNSTSADTILHEFYTPRVAKIVAKLYARDFEELGYSFDFPVDFKEGGKPL
jgi:hypothetical protein